MAIKDEVVAVFGALHINTVHGPDTLDEGLGMDSQELVSLVCELERHFGVPVSEEEIRPNMTVSDVETLMSGKVASRAPDASAAAAREGSLTEQIVVNAPVGEVYQALLQVQDWPAQLPHVERIDVIYDDGRFQEFYMTVRSADGHTIRVRSIRRCREGEILFFQPQPPAYLARHSGGWKFESKGLRQCVVTTYHEWTLNDTAADVFPATGSQTIAEQVERVLRDHARLALSSWKSIIEARGSHDPGTDSDPRPIAVRV